MYKLFFIAKNNMKKQRSDMITFLIITCLSALLIVDCVSALIGINHILDDKFEEINGSHVILYNRTTEAETESAGIAFTQNSLITDYEVTPVVQIHAEYKNAKDEEYSSYSFMIEDFDQVKRQMNVTIPEFGHNVNDILLPYNQKSSFDIGDVLQIKLDNEIYSFNVAGYLEDPYYCSTMNITTFYCGMHKDMIDKLVNSHPNIAERFNAHKGLADITKFAKDYTTDDLESDIAEVYKANLKKYSQLEPDKNYTQYFLINWDMMKGGSLFVPMIAMAIILLFGAIILIIGLIIISFSIKNFIQRNMKNTGIMEAAGYKVSELRWALTIEIGIVAAIGSAIGILISIFTIKTFGNIVSSVLGLSWNQPVNIPVAVYTFLGILAVVIFVSRLISRVYRKITVLDALRGGINTHNYKKNVFSFEKTSLPVSLTLSLKETFGNLGRNIALVIISAVLMIATLAGFGIKENYGDDPEAMLNIWGFELADAQVLNNSGTDIAEDLRKLPGVKNVLVEIGFEPAVFFNGKKDTVYTYAVDDFNNTQYTFMIEGRFPEKENEILVSNGVALDLGLKIGDVVEIEFADTKENYIITGINQRIERMGRTLYMRIDGAKKIIPGSITDVYLYKITAQDNVSFDMIKKEVKKFAEDNNLSIRCGNLKQEMDGTVKTVNASMNAVCFVILIITTLVVIFVESLIIRAKISRDWKNYGISKAIGQTSLGLMVQIMLTNIPAITIGALIGVVLSEGAGKLLTRAAFSLFAMKEAAFKISITAMLIGFLGIIFVAIITSFLTGLKVRRLIPVEMITEE